MSKKGKKWTNTETSQLMNFMEQDHDSISEGARKFKKQFKSDRTEYSIVQKYNKTKAKLDKGKVLPAVNIQPIKVIPDNDSMYRVNVVKILFGKLSEDERLDVIESGF